MSKKVDGGCEEAIGVNHHPLFLGTSLGRLVAHLAFYPAWNTYVSEAVDQKFFNLLFSVYLLERASIENHHAIYSNSLV